MLSRSVVAAHQIAVRYRGIKQLQFVRDVPFTITTNQFVVYLEVSRNANRFSREKLDYIRDLSKCESRSCQ